MICVANYSVKPFVMNVLIVWIYFLMYMLGLALAPNLARVILIPIYSGLGTTMFCFDYVHAKMNQI